MRGVRSPMGIQRGCQSEPLTTYVALERSFTRVAVHMRFQIPLLVEALATELTLVHAYLRMRPHVVGQVCQLFKSPPTFLALVWFFTCVSVAMNLHVDFLVKPLAAEIAAEGLVIRVSAHVRVQVRGAVEGLVALLANVWLGRCVGKLMTG